MFIRTELDEDDTSAFAEYIRERDIEVLEKEPSNVTWLYETAAYQRALSRRTDKQQQRDLAATLKREGIVNRRLVIRDVLASYVDEPAIEKRTCKVVYFPSHLVNTKRSE